MAIAPAGAPGTDLEVVHRVLGNPAIRQGAGPELVQDPAPEGTGQPGVAIDLSRHEVHLDGQSLKLTHKKFELLAYLVEHREQTVPRQELMDALWTDGEEAPNKRTIDGHIRRLRTKLGRLAGTVCTVRGQGYRFSEHPDVVIRPAREPGGR